MQLIGTRIKRGAGVPGGLGQHTALLGCLVMTCYMSRDGVMQLIGTRTKHNAGVPGGLGQQPTDSMPIQPFLNIDEVPLLIRYGILIDTC